MDYAKESLRLHGEWKGKIEVVTRVPVENKDDLLILRLKFHQNFALQFRSYGK